MKRTPLKRKTPLKPSRKPMKRTPFSKKTKRITEGERRSRAFRIEIHERYQGRWFCEICGHDGSFYEIQIMHLLPRSRFPRFKYVPENVRLGCVLCHQSYDRNRVFREAIDERLGWGLEKEKIRNGLYPSMF
jgi:hypothetical protein